MKAWAIKDWNEAFENASSRKLKVLDYVAAPTRKESARRDRLLATMPGVAAFGHFQAIVQFAATLSCRGILVRSGEPMTIDELALKICTPPALLKKSWPLLIDPKVGWLQEVEFTPAQIGPWFWIDHSANHPTPISHQTPHGSATGAADDRQIVGPACAGARASARVHPPTHTKPPPTHPPTQEGQNTNAEIRTVRSSLEKTGIFAAYPKHRQVGKHKALKAISEALDVIQARGEADPQAWLLARVEAFARSPAGNAGDFVPHAARWFADGRYDDPPEAWQEQTNGHSTGSRGTNPPRKGASSGVNPSATEQERFLGRYPDANANKPLPR